MYLDTSYLVRLYTEDSGADKVRALVAGADVACSLHGRIELISAFHRGYREGRYTRPAFLGLLEQLEMEGKESAISWLSADGEVVARAGKAYRNAPRSLFLRAADAMHLACAAENGFREIYSNDRHLLAAAPLFGLRPKNILA
jgi:predicted nucleic acid-binding protein